MGDKKVNGFKNKNKSNIAQKPSGNDSNQNSTKLNPPRDWSKWFKNMAEEFKKQDLSLDVNGDDQVIPSGEMVFDGLTTEQLLNFRVIPENDGGSLEIPEVGKTYEGDGFYFNPSTVNHEKGAYWFKISAGGRVTVSYNNKTGKFDYLIYKSWGWEMAAKAGGKKYIVGFSTQANFLPYHRYNPFINKF